MAAIKQDVNVPLVLTIGVVAGLLLIVGVIGVQGWYQDAANDEIAAKYIPYDKDNDLTRLKAGQLDNLSRYHWVDKSHNVVAIPIDAAMSEVVQTQGNLPTTQP